MKKSNLILNAAVAAALGFVAAPSFAALTNTIANTTYAVESFPQQDSIAVPASSCAVTSGAANDLVAGDTVVFTLSAGKFATAPGVTVSGAGATLAFVSNIATLSADGRSATFTVSTASAGATDKAALNALSLTNVGGQLSTAANTITCQPYKGATAVGAAAAITTSAASYTITQGAAVATTVDVANGGQGMLFRPGSTNVNVTGLASVTTAAAITGNKLIDGTTAMAGALGDTMTATMTGDFGAMSSMYLTTGTCAATAPSGSLTGTISGGTVSFTGLQLGSTYTLCAVANGTSVITAGGSGAAAALPFRVAYNYVARTAGATTYTPNPTVSSTTANTIAYNGAAVNVNYVVGNGAGYAMYMNVVNPSSSAVPVYITVRQADGVTKSGTLTSSLAANSSTLFTMAQIATATGANLTNETNRAAVTVFSPASIRVTNFMLNPGNAVTQIGQSF